MRRLRIPAIVALVILLGFLVWRDNYQLYHFAQVIPNILYRDGNRSTREFEHALDRGKIKTVIMLNDDAELAREPFKDEIPLCQKRGIRHIRLPIPLGGRPTPADVGRFIQIVQDPANQPVLVHCAQGVRRTGMMIAAYQESALNYDNAKARDAILPFGRKPESKTLEDIRNFIEDYDPKTQSLAPTHAPTTQSANE